MSTTKLDIAYSEFIMSVVPLLDQMDKEALIDLQSDINAKLEAMIDGAIETENDRMDEMRSDAQEEIDDEQENTGDTLSI
jgi:hypothetical protein